MHSYSLRLSEWAQQTTSKICLIQYLQQQPAAGPGSKVRPAPARTIFSPEQLPVSSTDCFCPGVFALSFHEFIQSPFRSMQVLKHPKANSLTHGVEVWGRMFYQDSTINSKNYDTHSSQSRTEFSPQSFSSVNIDHDKQALPCKS